MIKLFEIPSCGLTNDVELYDSIKEYLECMLNDGWVNKNPDSTEPIENYARLIKDNFQASLVRRIIDSPKYKYSVGLSIWGPDGLCIGVPITYDWELIKSMTKYCTHCNKSNVDTFRFSFAGRCCKECLPELKKRFEKPGWCN